MTEVKTFITMVREKAQMNSFPMDENYLLSTVRYVERNSVAA